MITMKKKVLEWIHFLGILVLMFFLFIQSAFFSLFLSLFRRVMIPTYIWTNAVIAAIVLMLLHIWSWRNYYNFRKYFFLNFLLNHTYIYFKQTKGFANSLEWLGFKYLNIIFMCLVYYMGTVKGVVNAKRIIRYNTVPQKTVSNVLWQQASLGSTCWLWLFTKK